MNMKIALRSFAGLMLAAVGLVSNIAYAGEPALSDYLNENRSLEARFDVLTAKAQTRGKVRVIVRLKTEQSNKREVAINTSEARRAAIAKAQSRVIARVARAGKLSAFKTVPYVAAEVNAEDLAALRNSPEVEAVFEDQMWPPALAESVPLIGADQPHEVGYSGAGQAVAVLDTGVDKTHPDLAGKVVAEACFSTSDQEYGLSSTCPNGAEALTGDGAAQPCDVYACEHGTHVAGIAAGRQGVAKDADIIAVQVFTKVEDQQSCEAWGYPTPCILYSTSDLMKGLETIYELRQQFDIAAVNMSLGGGQHTSACDGEPTTPFIDNLHAAGIASVIASGNESLSDSISAPACISSAISVGATDKFDYVADFSNSSEALDLLAPGVNIVSSVPGGYEAMAGTSMAAPHVAGAIAVLKARAPKTNIETLLSALRETGEAVTDPRNDLSRPRIQVDRALAALEGGEQPRDLAEALRLLAPVGTIEETRPSFIWTPAAQVSWYFVMVMDERGSTVVQGYVSAQEAGCENGGENCAVAPQNPLAAGQSYYWGIEAMDDNSNFIGSSDVVTFFIQ